jgi:copper ion binding protein
MRKIILFIAVCLLGVSCSSGNQKTESTAEDQTALAKHYIEVTFDVQGMTCEGCEKAIMASVNKLEGIDAVSASHQTGESVVRFDSTRVNTRLITEAITSAGYEVTGFE